MEEWKNGLAVGELTKGHRVGREWEKGGEVWVEETAGVHNGVHPTEAGVVLFGWP